MTHCANFTSPITAKQIRLTATQNTPASIGEAYAARG